MTKFQEFIRCYSAGLYAAGAFFPSYAVLLVFLCYINRWQCFGIPDPIFGILCALILWLLTSFFTGRLASPESSIPASFIEFEQRWKRLSYSINKFATGGAAEDVRSQKDEIDEILKKKGLLWVSGYGYIEIWERLHRLEEAMFDFWPPDRIYKEALYDDSRLSCSSMPARKELLSDLKEAAKSVKSKLNSNKDIKNERSDLCNIRKNINDYRDMRWNGFIEPRNHILLTMFVVSLAVFALLVLYILFTTNKDYNLSKNLIICVSGYFLVGMLIGVSHRLLDDLNKNSAIDDEGLSGARLLATPFFSGVIAICGVVLMSLLGNPKAEYKSIFNPTIMINYLYAAVFGFSPGLLFSLLQKQADKYKNDLKASQAGDGTSD